MTEERQAISFEDAVKMLPDGDTIHTMSRCTFGIVGGDWEREEVIKELQTHDLELSGEAAANMNHRLAYYSERGAGKWVFVETKEEPGE